MATYSTLADITDVALSVSEGHLLSADAQIDALLKQRKIAPELLDLPITVLTDLAVAIACRKAAIDGSIDVDGKSPLIVKAREYERDIERLEALVSHESLGIRPDDPAAGFGNFSIGRA